MDENSSSSSFASLAESDPDDELNTFLCQVDLSHLSTSLLKRAFNRLEIETLQTAQVQRECTQINGFSFLSYESKADFEADSKLIAKEKIRRILEDRDAIETAIPSAEDIIRGIKRSVGAAKGSTDSSSSSSTTTEEGSKGKRPRRSTQPLVPFPETLTDSLDSLDDNNYHRLEVIQKCTSKASSPPAKTPKQSPLKNTIHFQFQASPISTPTTSSVVVSQISPETTNTSSNQNQSLESESEEPAECDSQNIELFSDTVPALYDALVVDAPIQATQYEETVQRTNRILAKKYEHLRKSNQISNTLLRFKGTIPLATIDVPTALTIFNNHKPVPPSRATPLKEIASPLIPKPGLVNGNTNSQQVQQHPNLVASPAATSKETPTFQPATTHLPVFKPILKSTPSTTNLPKFSTRESTTQPPSTIIKYNYILCPVSSDSPKQILINQQTQQATISTSSVPAKLIPSSSFKASTTLRALSSSKVFFVNGTPRNVISAPRPFVGKNLFVLRKASVNASTSTTLTSQNPDLISSHSQFHLLPYENSNSSQTLIQHTLQSASSSSSPVNHQLLVQPN